MQFKGTYRHDAPSRLVRQRLPSTRETSGCESRRQTTRSFRFVIFFSQLISFKRVRVIFNLFNYELESHVTSSFVTLRTVNKFASRREPVKFYLYHPRTKQQLITQKNRSINVRNLFFLL
jgi:hypothetical protein